MNIGNRDMRETVKDIMFEGDVAASAVFQGHFVDDTEKTAAVTRKIEDVLAERPTEDVDVGMKIHYSRSGSILALRFIDPSAPKVSETMITLLPRKGREQKFDDLFVTRLCGAFNPPKVTHRPRAGTDRPRPPMA